MLKPVITAIALLSLVVACSDSNDKNARHDSAQSPEDVGGAAKDAGETSQDIPLFSEDTVDSVGAPPNPCGTYNEDFTRCEANPLYTAGNALSDGRLELFIADPSVLYDEEEQIWKAWWQSPLESDYLNANPKTAILYAESPDGVHWSVQDSPAMTTGADPDDWDFDRAETPSVLKVPSNPPDRRYVMYYTGGNFKAVASPFPGYPWYQIGVAFSADGKTFERLPAAESPYANSRTPFGRIDGLVWYGSDAFPDKATMHDGLVADPSVLIVDGVYHLFASSFAVNEAYAPIAFGISHATSTDGIHWVAGPDNPVMGGQQPSVLWDGSRFEIFYNGDSDAERAALPSAFNAIAHISHAYSTDGATAETFSTSDPRRVFSWDDSFNYERFAWLTGADVVLREDGYWLFYTGFSSVDPPKDFLVPANKGWCEENPGICICFDEASGAEVCLLETVMTLNLARRAP